MSNHFIEPYPGSNYLINLNNIASFSYHWDTDEDGDYYECRFVDITGYTHTACLRTLEEVNALIKKIKGE